MDLGYDEHHHGVANHMVTYLARPSIDLGCQEYRYRMAVHMVTYLAVLVYLVSGESDVSGVEPSQSELPGTLWKPH
jgi:hypothetical protein